MSDLLFDGQPEAIRPKDLTMDTILEAKALIEALAPKVAPDNVGAMRWQRGLRIIKSDMVGSDTIIVSKNLFDVLYWAAKEGK